MLDFILSNGKSLEEFKTGNNVMSFAFYEDDLAAV